jgi:hypothetical protein
MLLKHRDEDAAARSDSERWGGVHHYHIPRCRNTRGAPRVRRAAFLQQRYAQRWCEFLLALFAAKCNPIMPRDIFSRACYAEDMRRRRRHAA